MTDPSQRLTDRLLGASFALLLSAMALSGAVLLVEHIWVTLCLILVGAALAAGVGAMLWRQFRRF